MLGGLGEGLLILGIILLIGKVWAAWRLVTRIGWSPFWAILMLIPIIGEAILLWTIAFSPWPDAPETQTPETQTQTPKTGGSESAKDLWSPDSVGRTDLERRDTPPPKQTD